MSDKPKTIICDIDGVLLFHKNKGLSEQLSSKPLDGAVEKINEWENRGHKRCFAL